MVQANFLVTATENFATITSTIGLGAITVPLNVYQALITCNNTPAAAWVTATALACGVTGSYLRGVLTKLQQHGQTANGSKAVGLSVMATTKVGGRVYLTFGVAGALHVPCTRLKQNGGIPMGAAQHAAMLEKFANAGQQPENIAPATLPLAG